MDQSEKFGYLLIGFILIVTLSACSQRAITSSPDVEFQDVSLSLDTVDPQEHLHHFAYDRSKPLDIQVVKRWRRFNVTVTELTFTSPRGEPVPTLLFEPDGEGPFGGLVLMHGAPGTKENFKDWGVYYARYGFVAIAIDAPQFRSDHNIGHVSMALIWPRFEEKDLEEQSQLILDLQRAVDLLLTLENVDPERLEEVFRLEGETGQSFDKIILHKGYMSENDVLRALAEAKEAAERVRTVIDAHRFKIEGLRLRLTVSVGVAPLHLPGEAQHPHPGGAPSLPFSAPALATRVHIGFRLALGEHLFGRRLVAVVTGEGEPPPAGHVLSCLVSLLGPGRIHESPAWPRHGSSSAGSRSWTPAMRP